MSIAAADAHAHRVQVASSEVRPAAGDPDASVTSDSIPIMISFRERALYAARRRGGPAKEGVMKERKVRKLEKKAKKLEKKASKSGKKATKATKKADKARAKVSD